MNKNLLQYEVTRFALGVLAIFPLATRRSILSAVLGVVSKFLKRHRNIAHRNIALAFPEMSDKEKDRIFTESFRSLGDLPIDLVRFPKLTRGWAEQHIEFPGITRLRQVKEEDPKKGILLVTGHLGSFELSAYCLPLLYRPISFLVRDFTNSYLNAWWNSLRESSGNQVVSREGGYKKMVHLLRAGTDVGVLFDQNVTKNHALFVSWFGRPAATTKALALAALQTRAPIFVVALVRTDVDRYFYECDECDCSDLYLSESLTKQEKLYHITERLVRRYEALILKYPEKWLWIHRRWKTTLTGTAETFYSNC